MRPGRTVGRRCYDHLGGRLGAGLFALYQRRGWIEPVPGTSTVYRLTAAGREVFGGLGLPPEYLLEK